MQLEAFFRSFANRREVAAYADLAPMPWKSGRIDREQGISKADGPRLRTTMVELAWLWLRHQPGSALSNWFRERVGQTKGRVRRIAIVALARRLLVALWRYVEAGVIPKEPRSRHPRRGNETSASTNRETATALRHPRH